MSSFNKIKKLPKPILIIVVNLLKSIAVTFKSEVFDPNNRLSSKILEPGIYACWHNRLLGVPTFVPRKLRPEFAILVSQSRDGEYITNIVNAFGYSTIRGSTSKGGTKALVTMKSHLENGGCIVITPDGPRGPRYSIQKGVLWLASETGFPIIPFSLNSKKHWELKSWDRTQIPKPFTKAEFIIGEPIHINNKIDEKNKKHYQMSVRNQMMKITRWE